MIDSNERKLSYSYHSSTPCTKHLPPKPLYSDIKILKCPSRVRTNFSENFQPFAMRNDLA